MKLEILTSGESRKGISTALSEGYSEKILMTSLTGSNARNGICDRLSEMLAMGCSRQPVSLSSSCYCCTCVRMEYPLLNAAAKKDGRCEQSGLK